MRRYMTLLLLGMAMQAEAQLGPTAFQCSQGRCAGYGPPIGACGATTPVYTNLSPTPNVQYACVGTTSGSVTTYAWQQVTGGSGGGAVASVNGMTGAVTLTAAQVGALPTNAQIPYSQITGAPTIPTNTNQLTNGAGFVNATQAAAAAPVQSVNGQTGAVTVAAGVSSVNGQTGAVTIPAATPATSSAAGIVKLDPSASSNTLSPSATTDTTNASNITSGTIGVGRLPTIPSTQVSGLVPTVKGYVQLASGTATVTGLASGLTGCNVNDVNYGAPHPGQTVSGTTLTITGLGNDWIYYDCSSAGAPSGVPASATVQTPAALVSGLAASATTDTTNASNITSGKVPQTQITSTGSTLTSLLERIANASIAQNTASFSDGSGNYYSAGPLYLATGIYGDDAIVLTATENPDAFSVGDLLNIMSKFAAATNTNHEFPSAVNAAGQASSFCGAFDTRCAHAPVDGWATVTQALKLVCDKLGPTSTGCASAYNTYMPAIKLAFAAIPKNASHVPYVDPSDPWISATLFLESIRSTGEVANGAVWYAVEQKQMAALATAVGNSSDASAFTAEYNLVNAAIQSDLIDGSTGMLKTATLQNSASLDTKSSALFAYYGLGTQAQRTAIANYFNTNYATLVNGAGFILNTPTSGGFPYWGCIKPDGTTTQGTYVVSGTSCNYPQYNNTTTYQQAYWSDMFLQFNSILATVNPLKARQQIATAGLNANINTEWFPTTSLTPSGTNPNMESPQGVLAAAKLLPPVPYNTTAGQLCFTTTTQGQCDPNAATTTYTVTTGGITFSSASTSVAGYTSTSNNGTQVGLGNSTAATSWLDFLLGSSFANNGARCWTQTQYGISPFCVKGDASTAARMLFAGGTSMRWGSVANDPNSTTDVGFSRSGTSFLSLDSTTIGDGLGALGAGYYEAVGAIPASTKTSRTQVDFQGGQGRFLARGANASTQAPVVLLSLSSDASKVTSFAFGPAGVSLPAATSLPQIIATGSTPTVTAGAGAGTGATASVTGTNMAGVITLNTGTATASGTLFTLTFNGTLATAPQGCNLFPRGDAAAATSTSISEAGAPTTTQDVFRTSSAIAVSTAHVWGYKCI